ncbi:MAG: DNA repair protein RecN [Symploca sp. SIO3C6]|nr:DNA repair protein RecN [Symploca sp. SIO3C6]NET04008.1 DNA repair protein RecN [Symploca sp. SIO2B6]NET50002.1 DNA repair protein RecN [Merismopedia sp. SIO2A8]
MLLCLRIHNFALIDNLELEFSAGLNVLTGETGAGKSIILDAIDIALGGKISNRLIRTGTKRALVEATFGADQALKLWLSQQEIDLLDDNDLVCSREITASQGNLRSRSRLNGVLVNRQLMERVRERLVEITAQGQTVQLMSASNQRLLLDLYGGSPLLRQRELVASAYLASQEASKALEKRLKSEQQRWQHRDWLEYQIKELTAAHLTDSSELEQLELEYQRLDHVVELQQQSYQVYQALYQHEGGTAAADLLAQAEATLSEMVQYDEQLQPLLELVSAALAQVVEASHQINAYGDGLETEPERLQVVEERVAALKQICRKYGPTLDEAIAHYEKLQTELQALENEDQSLENLEKIYQQCQETLTYTCKQLTQLRRGTAEELEKRLVNELKPLAMDKVRFSVKIVPATPAATGADNVSFYFSPNPGEVLQPLSHTASGGEMNRFLLALKACLSTATAQSYQTLIFDEIDAGVSGRVAQAIAERLHRLTQGRQVLCVTHQPLIAAMADRHFRVDKQVVDQPLSNYREKLTPNQTLCEQELSDLRTVVRVSLLDNHRTRREEIAQLAGGHSAQEAMTFAESLLAKAANWREAAPTNH